MKELKPCPWCGCDDFDEHGNLYIGGHRYNCFFVGCSNCGVCGPVGKNKQEAVEYWNDMEQESK